MFESVANLIFANGAGLLAGALLAVGLSLGSRESRHPWREDMEIGSMMAAVVITATASVMLVAVGAEQIAWFSFCVALVVGVFGGVALFYLAVKHKVHAHGHLPFDIYPPEDARRAWWQG